MCQTFYLEHDRCTCVYIPANFTPCAAYTLAHPEGVISEIPNPFADPEKASTVPNPDPFADPDPKENFLGQASRPKLLTRACRGLDITYKDIDFMSIDVDDLKAPKGVYCSGGITVKLARLVGGGAMECELCERADAVELVGKVALWEEEEREKEMGKGKEKEKGIFHKTAQIGTAAVKSLKGAVSGRAKKLGSSSADHSTIGEAATSRASWAQRLKLEPADPATSMYVDKFGEYIAPFC